MTPCSQDTVEPLPGTAPTGRYWWILEHPGPWPARPISDEVLGSSTPWAVDLASREDTHVLLVRRPGSNHASARVWFADTETGALSAGWATPEPPDLQAVDESLTLVCTHGRRDQCCAVLGRPMLPAIPDAWECSHIGGHRFAPTILVLPLGLTFGRARPQDWPKVAPLGPEALTWFRGRVGLDPPGQVVDAYARGQWSLDLTCQVVCTLVHDDGAHRTYAVIAEDRNARARVSSDHVSVSLSCGAEPRVQQVWRISDWG